MVQSLAYKTHGRCGLLEGSRCWLTWISPRTSTNWQFCGLCFLVVHLFSVYIPLHVCYVIAVVSDSLWPMDCGPPGPSVHGILQARILEWVAMSPSRGCSGARSEPVSLRSPALAGWFFTAIAAWEALLFLYSLAFGAQQKGASVLWYFHCWPLSVFSQTWFEQWVCRPISWGCVDI